MYPTKDHALIIKRGTCLTLPSQLSGLKLGDDRTTLKKLLFNLYKKSSVTLNIFTIKLAG